MVGLLIFVVALLGLTKLTISSVHTSDEARRVTAAATLAQAKIEQLEAVGYALATSSAAAESLTETGATSGALFYTRSWTVTPNAPVAGAKTVLVTVTWTDALSAHQLQTQSIIIS